ncbi:plasmid partition protein ParG [Microcoleus sp. CAWBG58]|uniref:plasmid partition protein ParG n=1 Tax=Microcoleus sp. CAWBG58 TaxID=2841651 RepID=UPI0025DA5A18|nr:plasmid partition protein ParG [Microcoleus sp. CAWBG58]
MKDSDKEKPVKLCFYCDDDLRSRFRWVCAYNNASMNQVLLELVENWLVENTPKISNPSSSKSETPPKSNPKRGKVAKTEDLST